MRLPSELRRRPNPFLEVAVSVVTTAWSDPLALGSCAGSMDSTGASRTAISERRSGICEIFDGPRVWTGEGTLPRE